MCWRSCSACRPRQADDGDAARRVPLGGRRRGGLGHLPHGVRLGRGATAPRRCCSLRRGASLRLGRPQHRLRPDPALDRAHRQGSRKYGVFLAMVSQRRPSSTPHPVAMPTLFAMRMTNDRDQAILRSAISDAATNLLAFLPSLSTREVFAFGEGVAMPTRLKFKQLPPTKCPRASRGALRRAVRHQRQPGFRRLGARALARRHHQPAQRHRRSRARRQATGEADAAPLQPGAAGTAPAAPAWTRPVPPAEEVRQRSLRQHGAGPAGE